MATTIDLTAKETVNITHKVGLYGSMIVTVLEDGNPLNITNALIYYEADSLISKSLGDGITITDGPNGTFKLELLETDASTIIKNTKVKQECKIVLSGKDYPLFDGILNLETTIFTIAS